MSKEMWELVGFTGTIIASYILAGVALYLGFHIAGVFFPSMCTW